jgi:hypothetical protein
MPAEVEFFDMSVSVTPPAGHLEPVPLTLGPNWQQNDIRTLIVAGLASGSSGETAASPMTPDPPTGFTTAYDLAPTPGFSTQGVYYRGLVNGDSDTSVAWPKPPNWYNYLFTTLTARGVSLTTAPTAGRLTWSHTRGDVTFPVGSVTVPAAGSMVFLLATVPDPDGGWPVSMGVPAGWTNMVATDKSGATYYQHGTEASVMVIGKKYASAGTTGTVTVPCGVGRPAFVGMYVFFTPAPDVSVSLGAA